MSDGWVFAGLLALLAGTLLAWRHAAGAARARLVLFRWPLGLLVGMVALAMVRDFPLAGTVGGSFYNVFLSYRTPDYGYGYVDHTHNDFVEIATDYGLVGLGLLGALVALTLWTVLKVMARRRSSLPRGMAFGVAMSVVALLIHSTVDFNLQIPANALTMVVILAMGWVAYRLPSSARRHRALPERQR